MKLRLLIGLGGAVAVVACMCILENKRIPCKWNSINLGASRDHVESNLGIPDKPFQLLPQANSNRMVSYLVYSTGISIWELQLEMHANDVSIRPYNLATYTNGEWELVLAYESDTVIGISVFRMGNEDMGFAKWVRSLFW